MQRGHAPWRGNVTVPQRRHSEPSSTGAAAVPAIRSGATGTMSRCSSIYVCLLEVHAAARCGWSASGGTPTIASANPVKSSPTRVSATMPFGRYQCQMLL